MNATANSPSATPAEAHTRRLLVRMNTTLFYCLGAAVLLESAAVAQAARAPGEHPNATWLAETQERAQSLRQYAASVWPEFAWEAACAAIGGGHRMNAAQDAAAMAVADSDHMAMFYRALSRIAEDPALRRVLENIAMVEETRRDRVNAIAGRGLLATLRKVHFIGRYVEHTRTRVVRRAFDLLQQHWLDTPPFPAIEYDAFLARARVLLMPHLQLDWPRRVLYRGWLKSGARHATGTAPRATRIRDSDIPSRVPGPARNAACALPHAMALR